MATLGIVELFVFLLLKYANDIDKERKAIFGEVHFALFYTAILNAFQSIIVAFFTTRVSSKLWVQTEHLELDHYVEIREEFDRVQTLREESSSPNHHHNNVFGISSRRFRHRYYLELLIQVNFHSLRLQFLESNHLPLTLKVSDYLKRAEQHVLMKLVHVSGVAWLLLTGGLNLIYFVMGMVAHSTGSSDIISTYLSSIFFVTLVCFILICWALYAKMRRIFQTIL